MNTKIEPKILKGFRDFLPPEAVKRQYAVGALKRVFELYGFEPLETPTLEYEEILKGKYGEEGEKLMYRFTDLGGRMVAMRYDQTVPLARVIAQYQNELPMPFKRYQIQPVWRAENTQKGRYREFMQMDVDIVGSSSSLTDAQLISLAVESFEMLGFKNFKVLINDRSIFSEFKEILLDQEKDLNSVIRTIDKLKKIGREGVLNELTEKGFSTERATYILQTIENKKPTEKLNEIFSILQKMGVDKSKYEFSPTLARGLDYYTGLILEVEIEGYNIGSVAGGGRYDNLIGIFAGRQIPAVGFAFGFDRLIEAMEQFNLFPSDLSITKALVTVFNQELLDKSIQVLSILREKGINSEIYDNVGEKLDKQIKYADKKGIPYVIIIGPDEVEKNVVNLRNMKTREQETVFVDQLSVKIGS